MNNRTDTRICKKKKYWGKALKGAVPAMMALLILLFGFATGTHANNTVQTIELEALEKIINDANYTGFVVFMASWCPPCKEELPALADLFREYYNKGIQIIAVSLDSDGPAAVQPLIDRLQIPFPVYWVGKKGIIPYRVIGIPLLMVIKNGKIVERHPGAQTPRQLEKKIGDLQKS